MNNQGNRKESIRVMLLCQYFPPDITAAAFRMGELTKFLLRKGYRVDVLTSTPHKSSVPDPDSEPVFPGNRCFLKVDRIKIRSRFYLVQYAKFVFLALFKGMRFKKNLRPDIILASSPPLSVWVAGYVLAGIMGCRFFLDVRDLWPETPLALKKIKAHSLLFWIFRNCEHFMYRHADAVVCVSRDIAREVSEFTKKTVKVVYNGISAEDVSCSVSGEREISGNMENRKMRVCYYGNLGLAQGLDVLLDAAQIAAGECCFSLIGSGAVKKQMRSKAERAGLDNVRFYEPMERAELSGFVNANFDALFVNLHPHPVFKKTIPSKVFEYLTHGMPVVYGISGEGAEILARSSGNVRFISADADSLARTLLELKTNYHRHAEAALKENPGIAGDFIREKQFTVLESLLNEKNLVRRSLT